MQAARVGTTLTPGEVIEQEIFKRIKEHRGDDDDEAPLAMKSCVDDFLFTLGGYILIYLLFYIIGILIY